MNVLSATMRGVQKIAYDQGFKDGYHLGQEGIRGAIAGLLDEEIDMLVDQQSILRKARADKAVSTWEGIIERLDNLRCRISSL